MTLKCKDTVSTASTALFTSVWRQVEELKFSLADHEGRVNEWKKKEAGAGFHVNTEGAPISSKLILLGAGPANGTCKAGPLCIQQTQKGKCKEAQLICILLLFQRRQNVLEHKVMNVSPTESLCLHIECKKKKKGRRSGGNGC